MFYLSRVNHPQKVGVSTDLDLKLERIYLAKEETRPGGERKRKP